MRKHMYITDPRMDIFGQIEVVEKAEEIYFMALKQRLAAEVDVF